MELNRKMGCIRIQPASLLRAALALAMMVIPSRLCGQEPDLEGDDAPGEQSQQVQSLMSAIRSEGREEMDTAMVIRILQRNPGILDSTDAGYTPLHRVVEENLGTNAIRLLLRFGARVDLRDRFGRTPLFYADGTEKALILLESGAEADARDNRKMTPLFLARDPELIALLLSRSADINAISANGSTPLLQNLGSPGRGYIIEYLIDHGAAITPRTSDGDTPLHVAVRRSDSAAVALLLRAGADAGARNRSGNTPLHHAAIRSMRPDAVRALLASRPPLEAMNRESETPLEIAVGHRNAMVVDLLLDAGARIPIIDPDNIENSHEVPLLTVAAINGDTATIAAFLRHGADVHVRAFGGTTSLHYAADGATAQMLLDGGARRDARDSVINRDDRAIGEINGNMTPIECAVSLGREDVMMRLLEAGADPGAPLEIAAMHADPFWMSVLLRYGAVPTAATLQVARRYRNTNVAALLEKRIREVSKPKGRR